MHYSADNLEEYDARLDMKLPLINVIDKLTERIRAYSKIENIQVGLFRLEVEDFPEKVFQEALLNALSHRDYQSNAAVYVKQYPDRIVIENPGGFLDGITENNIITHPSVPRNKLIAETLQNLKYVQRTGQGVDIIFKEMISMGKPYPKYTRDKTIQYIKAKNMILEYLQSNKSNSRITSAKIQEMCGFTKQQARGVIDKMRGEGLLKIHNHGKKSYYEKL